MEIESRTVATVVTGEVAMRTTVWVLDTAIATPLISVSTAEEKGMDGETLVSEILAGLVEVGTQIMNLVTIKTEEVTEEKHRPADIDTKVLAITTLAHRIVETSIRKGAVSARTKTTGRSDLWSNHPTGATISSQLFQSGELLDFSIRICWM